MQNAFSGNDELVYVCQQSVKTGDVISFNVDVTPRQDLTVWVFGCDYKQQGWTNEWKAQTIWNEYAEWPSDGSAASVSLTAKGNVDAFSIVVRYRDTTQNYKENVVTISNLTVARDIVEVAEDGTITMQNTLSGDNKPYYVCDKSVKAGDVISFNLDISPRQHIALFIFGCDYSVEGWTKQWHAQTFNPEWNEWPSDGSPAQVTYTVPSNADAFTIMIEYRDAEQNFYENVVTISNLDVAGDIV